MFCNLLVLITAIDFRLVLKFSLTWNSNHRLVIQEIKIKCQVRAEGKLPVFCSSATNSLYSFKCQVIQTKVVIIDL